MRACQSYFSLQEPVSSFHVASAPPTHTQSPTLGLPPTDSTLPSFPPPNNPPTHRHHHAPVLPTPHVFQSTSSSFRARRQAACASANTTEEPKPSPARECYDSTLTLPNHFDIKMRVKSASQANFGLWAGSRSCKFLPNMGTCFFKFEWGVLVGVISRSKNLS